MKLTFLGGADEVGASCTLVEVAGRKLVVDCGIRLSGPDPLPWMQPIQDAGGADAILLTHAHLDHCGALPLLVQTEQVPLYMTPPTRHLMRIMLQDSLKIMAIDAESEGEIPLYPAAAVEQVIARSNTVQWFEPLDLFGGEVRLTYFPAGHILGASSILVESEEGTILMGGDIALTPQRSIPGADWSKIPKRVDACVCESTYGGRAHASRSGEEMRLIQQAETVIGRGGTMVIPAFALGRAQEVLLILGHAIEKGLLAPVPIYFDGMIRSICQAYWEHADYASPWFRARVRKHGNPFTAIDCVKPVIDAGLRPKVARERPSIIVSSSGMLTGGPSAFYAAQVAEDPSCFIAITGYQDEESPGRALQDVAKAGGGSLKLGDQTVALRCGVGTYGLSAHADTTEIVGLLAALQPAKTFLVHGNASARQALDTALSTHAGATCVQPRLGESFVIEGQKRKRRLIPDAVEPSVKAEPEPIPEFPYQIADIAALAMRLMERDKGSRSYSVLALVEELGHEPQNIPPAWLNTMTELLRRADGPFKSKGTTYRLRHHKGIVVGAAPAVVLGDVPAMNQHEVGEYIRATFADPTLYRVGVEVPIRRAKLYFHFPIRAAERHAERIRELPAQTGWHVEMHDQTHHGALQDAARALLPPTWNFAPQLSLHVQSLCVEVKVNARPDPQICEQVNQTLLDMTGFRFSIKDAKTGTRLWGDDPTREVSPIALDRHIASPAEPDRPLQNPPMEIKEAYRTIRAAFDGEHAVLKVGFKNGAIEVGFITPEVVGATYKTKLLALQDLTGYKIGIRPHPDQNAIITWLNARFQQEGFALSKPPSLDLDNKIATIALHDGVPPKTLQSVSAAFTVVWLSDAQSLF